MSGGGDAKAAAVAGPPNALSLFFPTDQPTPTTFNHLLTLPPLLEPISPALASLHLARIRLVLSVPPGVIDQTAWCPTCGGIREALVKHDPSGSSPSPSKSKAGAKAKGQASPGRGRRRKANTNGARGGGSKTRWAKMCGRCGAEYKRPKPDMEARAFPSARAVRAVRMKRKSAEVDTDTAGGDGAGGPSRIGSSEMSPMPAPTSPPLGVPAASGPLSTMPLPTTAPPPLAEAYHPHMPSFQPPPPPPPRYVHNQGLMHVHTSSPHPPTYPQPPPPKHLSPPPKEKSKKRKKSGLARLLAENKEREMGSTSGGAGGSSWGLD